MNLGEAAKLMEKYGTCQECGSNMVGGGAGTLQVTDDTFQRTCKCGWKVEVKHENK